MTRIDPETGPETLDLAEVEARVVAELADPADPANPVAPPDPPEEPYNDEPYGDPSAEANMRAHPFDPRARFKPPTAVWFKQAAGAARNLPRVFEPVLADEAAWKEVESHKQPQLEEALVALAAVAQGYNADVLLDAFAALIAVTLVDTWVNASSMTALNALSVTQFQLSQLFYQMVACVEEQIRQQRVHAQLEALFTKMAEEGHTVPAGLAGSLPN